MKAIVDTVRADDGEDQMAWRDGMRRIARLVPMPNAGQAARYRFGPNVSYLVTGGLGGLGLGIAELAGVTRRMPPRARGSNANASAVRMGDASALIAVSLLSSSSNAPALLSKPWPWMSGDPDRDDGINGEVR